MKTLSQSIIIIISGLALTLISCEKLDIRRIMDTETDAIEINSSVVVAHGTILDIGDDQIVEHGHCWSTDINPTIDNYKSELGATYERIAFTSELNNIIPGIEHHVRAYIYDGTNYVYGSIRSFILSSEHINFLSEKIDSTETSVNISSNVDSIGSIYFNDHGHCWSQFNPPTIDDNITSFGQIDTNKAIVSAINNLTFGRYYFRGYMISESGVIYSNTVVFDSEITVGSSEPNLKDDTLVVAYGSIKSLSTKPIIDHGHIWSHTWTEPHLQDDEDYKFNSLGSIDKLAPFSSEIDNLIPGRTYYIWSYATDGDRTGYGDTETIIMPDK